MAALSFVRLWSLGVMSSSLLVACGDDGTSATGGTGGAGGETSVGGATGCTPGAEEDCYTGPAATEGVGLCVGGTRTCLGDGSGFGACEGEITPVSETCATAEDEDCDGDANEEGAACVCVPGTSESCYTGPLGTEGVGLCAAGTRTCNADGLGHEACTGESTPVPETCGVLEDEDCDGHTPSCTVDHLWSKRFGDMSDQSGPRVATDASGNIVIVGNFFGTIDLGGGPLTSAAGAVFVAKLDPAGNHIWSKRFGDTNSVYARSVATDAAGNVVITGHFDGAFDFGGGPLTSAGGSDVFVAKFDPAGNHLWSKRFGDPTSQGGYSVATDAAGNVVVMGNFFGTIDLGSGLLTSAGSSDVFVAKFDPAGNPVWSQRFGGANDQSGESVATDAAGNAVVTGAFTGIADFGGGPLTGMGDDDIFVAKLDATGNHLWSKRFGDADYQVAKSVATDAAGNVVLGGYFFGAVDLGGGLLTSAGGADVFVAKLDPAGNHVSSKRFGDTSNQLGQSVAVDTAGHVVITGGFDGTVDFGGGALTSAGDQDVFVAKFDPAANLVWSQRFGGGNSQHGLSLATDAAANVVMAGYFYGSVDFGGGALTSQGGYDVFVAKLGP